MKLHNYGISCFVLVNHLTSLSSLRHFSFLCHCSLPFLAAFCFHDTCVPLPDPLPSYGLLSSLMTCPCTQAHIDKREDMQDLSFLCRSYFITIFRFIHSPTAFLFSFFFATEWRFIVVFIGPYFHCLFCLLMDIQADSIFFLLLWAWYQ